MDYPRPPRLSDNIPQRNTIKVRLLSLIDTCIYYLVSHPEISTSSLPSKLQEHIWKHEDDPYYRVLPQYSYEIYQSFSNPIFEYYRQLDHTVGEANRINIVSELLQYIDGNLNCMRYLPRFSNTIFRKLIDFPNDGLPVEISQYYLLKWFDYKLVSPPS